MTGSNMPCKTSPNEISFLHNSLTESNSTNRNGPANLCGQSGTGQSLHELCNSSLPDTGTTQQRISPVCYLSPSVLHRTKISSLACKPLNFSTQKSTLACKTKRSFFCFSLLPPCWHMQEFPSSTSNASILICLPAHK